MKCLNNCSCMAYTNSDISSCFTEQKENITEEHSQEESLDLPHFDFFVIANETNNFSFNNPLGKGGFGSVYKVTTQFDDTMLNFFGGR